MKSVSDSFEFKKEFRTADVGGEEVEGNIPEVSHESIPDGRHVLRTAHIDAHQIKTETGAVFGNIRRLNQMLNHIYRLFSLHAGVIGELTVLSFDRGCTGNKDDIPKKPSSLEFRRGADDLLTGSQNIS